MKHERQAGWRWLRLLEQAPERVGAFGDWEQQYQLWELVSLLWNSEVCSESGEMVSLHVRRSGDLLSYDCGRCRVSAGRMMCKFRGICLVVVLRVQNGIMQCVHVWSYAILRSAHVWSLV